MNTLSVSDLHVKIAESHILHGVTFEVPQRSVTALLGRNGVGKSSTLKAIMGLYPSTGSVLLNGESVSGLATFKIAQRGIAYVPEDRDIFASLSVKENLALAVRGEKDSDREKMVNELFPELVQRANQRAGTLSGGQQQMVAIARALINHNEILLIDEPTKGLAPKLVTEVADVLNRVAGETTMLLVEQNLSMVRHVAQHLIVMDQGRVVFEGGPENLQNPEWVHSMLGVSARQHK